VSSALARLWIAAIDATHGWPQAARTRLANAIGTLLWLIVFPRRRIAETNLRICFPRMPATERARLARSVFRNIARATLDHSVLACAARDEIERYVQVDGEVRLTDPANRPLILIAPHFVGLDAGGLRINTLARGVSVYARQSNASWDDWLLRIRRRFSDPLLLTRGGRDLRVAVRAIEDGLPFYYLPDMDNGAAQSIFAPFFGVPAATIPMVSRLARIAKAKVMLAVTEMTADGYRLHLEPPLADFPGGSVEEDTARVNREIERWVLRMNDQYLWTHRRFKTRPPGAPSLYG